MRGFVFLRGTNMALQVELESPPCKKCGNTGQSDDSGLDYDSKSGEF